MAGFDAVIARFSTLLRKVDGVPFHGAIMPADEGSGSLYLSAKLILRTQPDAAVSPRDVIFDPFEQRYLVAELAHRSSYKTFRMFELNADFNWRRQGVAVDKLTGLKRGSAAEELGRIPVYVEVLSDAASGAIRVSEETRRIVTGARLQLGDQLDDATVRQVVEVLGVTYAEIR